MLSMASGNAAGPRNQARGYYVPLGTGVPGKILSYTPGSGSGGSAVKGSFTTATWAAGGTAPSPYTSTISTTGAGVLRDLGQTVVSAGRVFRRIQLICPTVSTFGVSGTGAVNTARNDYLTGYIELHSAAIADDYPGGTGPPQVAFYPVVY
uniref:Uncharacterized protein n=1 Tax=viral metagenome TaxID=1070528 RepID=A0A6C0LRG8_9ZZZZ